MNERVSDSGLCRTCRHYYITWNKKFPYGCKAAGFQSVTIPCLEVYAASGQPCLLYERKAQNRIGR